MNSLDKIVDWLQQDKAFAAVRIYETTEKTLQIGTPLYVTEDEILGEVSSYQDLFVERARKALRQGKTRLEKLTLGEGTASVCFEIVASPQKLVIVGAGHVGLPLAQIAAIIGFAPIVIDDRPEYACRERFPMAHEIIAGPFLQSLNQLTLDANTYVVLVTRGHVYDRDCLRILLQKPEVPYIGMICSRRRKESTFGLLRAEGYSEEQLSRIFAPIGLPNGGETPEEIALCILDEIVSLRHRGAEWVWKVKNQG